MWYVVCRVDVQHGIRSGVLPLPCGLQLPDGGAEDASRRRERCWRQAGRTPAAYLPTCHIRHEQAGGTRYAIRPPDEGEIPAVAVPAGVAHHPSI